MGEENKQATPKQRNKAETPRGSFRASGRVTIGVFIGILLVLAIAGACVIGWFGKDVRDRIRPPTPTPLTREIITVKPPTIQEIQQMAELSTVKFGLTAEVADERVPDDFRANLGIKEELLLLAYGEVAAGFDLGKMDDGDIWVDGTRIQLQLPSPEILYSRLDPERTRVIYYKKSILMQRDIAMEGKAREEAEKAIREAALQGDILDHAEKYGELFFANWLRSMGFTEVQVVVR